MYKDEYILQEIKKGRKYEEVCNWFDTNSKEGMWQKLNKLIKSNGAIVLFGSEPFSSALRMSNIKNYKYDWVWEKQKASNFMGVKYSPLKYHEVISVFSNNKHAYYPQRYKVLELDEIMSLDKKQTKILFENKGFDRFGKVDRRKNINNPHTNKAHIGININRTRGTDDGYRNPKSILKINKPVNSNIHPTQKPVALMEYLIKTYTNENELVLDFAMGSGTTGLACKNLNRKFIGIEKEEKYYKIAYERLRCC